MANPAGYAGNNCVCDIKSSVCIYWPYRSQEPLIKPALALLNAHGADFDAAQVTWTCMLSCTHTRVLHILYIGHPSYRKSSLSRDFTCSPGNGATVMISEMECSFIASLNSVCV